MACDFDVFLPSEHGRVGTDAAVSALDLIDQLESQLTVYRQQSEVLDLNRRAADEPVEVEPGLFALLERGIELWRLTGGAFDMTSGPLSKAWGFFRREGRFPAPEEIAAARTRLGSDAIELDPTTRSVRFSRAGIEINLNAIGKGYALDRAAARLVEAGVSDFLIHGGQSSVLARGRYLAAPELASARPAPSDALAGWPIHLVHPLRPNQKLAELRLTNQAVGTSGSGNQFFYFQGKRYGHIIDPRTGYPAETVLSATVVAPDAATADALATACFVLDVEQSLSVVAGLPGCGAVLLVPGERAGTVRLVTHGIAEDCLTVFNEEPR